VADQIQIEQKGEEEVESAVSGVSRWFLVSRMNERRGKREGCEDAAEEARMREMHQGRKSTSAQGEKDEE